MQFALSQLELEDRFKEFPLNYQQKKECLHNLLNTREIGREEANNMHNFKEVMRNKNNKFLGRLSKRIPCCFCHNL
jgi:hypothetical protein